MNVVTTKPLLRSLHLWEQALHRKPELGQMIRYGEMHSFMSHEVMKHKLRRKNQTPVEREVSAC